MPAIPGLFPAGPGSSTSMQFLLSHIESVIAGYSGNPPLAVFLKNYFRQYPKLGSRDRKAISEAVFIYYRCAFFLGRQAPVLQVIKKGTALCKSDNVFLEKILSGVAADALPEPRFEFTEHLSAGITADAWLPSLWHQPRLFIRARRELQQIQALLAQHDITSRPEPTRLPVTDATVTDCLSLKNGAAIDKVLPEDAYVVQDWASQASIQLALSVMEQHNFIPQRVWDVCSGAGGKSILLKDKLPPFKLVVSDIRESILHNLKMRFQQYRLSGFETKIIDGTDTRALKAALGKALFDAVICDVPCSGSGTWARTPEQFHYFESSQLEKFRALQYPIAFNAQQYVVQGGFFVYITCSVFAAENEAVVQRLQQDTGLQLLHSGIIDGISREADCMFVAVFRK